MELEHNALVDCWDRLHLVGVDLEFGLEEVFFGVPVGVVVGSRVGRLWFGEVFDELGEVKANDLA